MTALFEVVVLHGLKEVYNVAPNAKDMEWVKRQKEQLDEYYDDVEVSRLFVTMDEKRVLHSINGRKALEAIDHYFENGSAEPIII